jgi:hypothetical protein
MPQICDMGQTALLPLRRKACCGFFDMKNPTASAGFETAILGTLAASSIFRRVHKVRKGTITFVVSVCPPALSNSAHTGRIIMQFDV